MNRRAFTVCRRAIRSAVGAPSREDWIGAPILAAALTRKSLVVHVYLEDRQYYTPMLSNPQAGVFDVRLPLNVATGGCVWPRRGGRRVAVPRSALAEAAQRIVLRRPVLHLDGAV
ncbi:MAG: hypothetical protein ACYDD1_18130 [Caulobacteraceae bacterium]